ATVVPLSDITRFVEPCAENPASQIASIVIARRRNGRALYPNLTIHTCRQYLSLWISNLDGHVFEGRSQRASFHLGVGIRVNRDRPGFGRAIERSDWQPKTPQKTVVGLARQYIAGRNTKFQAREVGQRANRKRRQKLELVRHTRVKPDLFLPDEF